MSRAQSVLRSSAALAIIFMAQPAWGQDTVPPADVSQSPASAAGTEPASGTEIVVTGSRIRRDPLSQDSPIVFVDQDDIDKTGLNSIADVLQRLPSAAGGLNSKFNNSGNFGNPPDGGGVGAGAAEIDLRYLGSKRTLVLVDGLRFVNAASASGVPGSVDLNAIPESMIERVEVLQDGASAIYGSDAIAGVVNIITKKKQDGFEASAQLGMYGEGDGESQNYQLSWGSGSDKRASIVIGANFVKQEAVSSGDRDISQFPTPGASACDAGCSSGTPLGRFIVLGQDLTLIAPVPADEIPTLADFRPWAGAADRFNFAPFNFIQTPLKRYGVFANFRYEVADDINFTAKAMWNNRKSKNQAAPIPLFLGPDGGNANLLDRISIDATNPFNPFGVTLESGVDFETGLPNGLARNYDFIGRRLVEAGPRRYNQSVDTWYGTATLDGSLSIGGKDWYWDINAVYGRNKAKQKMFGNINSALLQQALGPIADCTGACVPFNVFGGQGSITEAMLDFVAFDQRDKSEQRIWDLSANATGNLFELPGGPLQMALGAEHRDQRGSFDPDPVVVAGESSDIPALPTSGHYNVDEIYAELNAPLFADRPFLNLLEFTGAARWTNYSTSGSTTTFKAGVNWKPIPDLRLRATWAEGFRAPTIGELFGTPSRFDQTITDPCSDLNNSGASATVRANCIAQGVPADGSYVQINPQISVITSGSEDLKPETSKSWVVGAVLSPSAIPRFSIEANYFNIKVDGAIQAIAGQTLLSRCAELADQLSCDRTNRTSSGALVFIEAPLENIAGIETDGFDITLNYRSPEFFGGTLGLFWANSILRNYTLIVPATEGTTEIEREGTEQGSPDQAFPKYKSTAIFDWDAQDWGLSLTGRYIGKVTESQNDNKLGSRLYVDVQGRLSLRNWEDRFQFAAGVNNLFDKDPPGCISCGLNNFDPTTYDVPGRYFYVRGTVKM